MIITEMVSRVYVCACFMSFLTRKVYMNTGKTLKISLTTGSYENRRKVERLLYEE